MILGIDLGASSTDFVLMDKREILKKKSIQSIQLNELEKEIKKLSWPVKKIKLIALTGGKSARARTKLLGCPVKKVPELLALSAGAVALSGKRNALVASLGTGTCLVSARKNTFAHAGGTGIGGGTLLGLSKLLLDTTDLEKINSMAEKGNRENIDLLVRDVVGAGIGSLPGNATASNFAKLKRSSRQDVAAGLVNLVAEANAMVIVLATRDFKQKNVVLTGKLLEIPSMRKRLVSCLKTLGFKPFIPENSAIATAVGAVVSTQEI